MSSTGNPPVPADPLEVAEKAARAAGAILLEGFGREGMEVERKGAVDLVTEMDRAAESEILERLRSAFPSHSMMAEESAHAGGTAHEEAEHLWIVDPLDGTTNYAHGHPQWAISIGYARAGRVVAGVVYDAARDELFAAADGKGATLNGKPIEVSRALTLDESLVATGFPYDRRERIDFYMPFYRAAVLSTQGVRRAGAAALDMAWVACGRLDAYFEFGIQPWDVAAGEILVREAGGMLSDMRGGEHRLQGRNTLASNGRVHDATLAMLARAWPRED